jgi:hypothetical protein
MGSDVKTMSEAWALWDKICADDRIALLAEPEAITFDRGLRSLGTDVHVL